jgi:hypothetical protein
MLEGEDLVQFLLQLANKALFIVFCPFSVYKVGFCFRRFGIQRVLQAGLEVIVGNVRVTVVFN